MKTPICDFLSEYKKIDAHRLHMPGHKGSELLGAESLDITEIEGADSLYEASGIIMESEKTAGSIFGTDTFFSAEGSSLSIRAMLYLTALYAKAEGKKPFVLAGRNAHKSFLSAASLIDIDVEWFYPEKEESYLSCKIDAECIEKRFYESERLPSALYITSPDYLGNMLDISGISKVCRKFGVLLLVDNAHGAYLKFLKKSRHPIDLGADLCCDSAHKTLHALTGSGYLHISKSAPTFFKERAKGAMALFGSTSPSYLILASLDKLNAYLSGNYKEKLEKTVLEIEKCKQELTSHGYTFIGDEPLKLTISAKPYGYTGYELSKLIREKNIVSEFCDPDFLVLMFSPENKNETVSALLEALISIPQRDKIVDTPPVFSVSESVISPREALLSPSETVPVRKALGKILAVPSVACPPAVPIVVSGERIGANAINCFSYYGIKECTVLK